MKESNYNFYWKQNDKKYVFNSTTCALAEIDDAYYQIINKLDSIEYDKLDPEKKMLVDNMLKGNYITGKKIDEIKMLKMRNNSHKFSSNGLGLTIAPTLSCNFACPYCYESPKNSAMSQQTIDALIVAIESAAKLKKPISITWYGGEPLLKKELIFELAEKFIKICETNGSHYGSYMVTNGYYLDKDTIERLKTLKVGGVQITLDGPPAVHNMRRKLKDRDGDTFYRILNNVKLAKELGLNPDIRINIDKTNLDEVDILLDILESNDLKDLSVYLGKVTEYTSACNSMGGSCFNTEQFAYLSLDFFKKLHNRGFKSKYYPSLRGSFCMADASSGFVVDPDGYLYKCWNEVGRIETAVGKIQDIVKMINGEDELNKLTTNVCDRLNMFSNAIEWIDWSPFNFESCKACKLLPICMGGCPYQGREKGNGPECEKWKYNLEEVIKNTVMEKMHAEETVS